MSSMELGQISPKSRLGLVRRANVSPIFPGDGSQVSSGGFTHSQCACSALSPHPCCTPPTPHPIWPVSCGPGSLEVQDPSLSFRLLGTHPRSITTRDKIRSTGSSAIVWPPRETQLIPQPHPFYAIIELLLFIEGQPQVL